MRVRSAVISFLSAIGASIAPQTIAADWADPAKVLRIAFPIDVSGLDPAGTQETYASLAEQRIFDAQAPWCTNVFRISSTVVAPQIRGYRKNVHYFLTPWQYLDIDTTAPSAGR